MAYQLNANRSKRKARRVVNLHQNKFPLGYISTIDNSRRPTTSLSDMTNMEMIQDNVVRPRPPLIRYGTQPANTVIGRGKIRYNGSRSILWAQNVAGVGKLYKQTDGGSFTLIGGTYDDEAWLSCVQSKNKAYIFNGVDNLSYVDLATNTVSTYTELTTPVISSVTKTGMTGSTFPHYYRVSANNDVGESIASVAVSVTSGKPRDNWIENTDYNTISWSAVTNATSYTVYYGTTAGTTNELFTVGGNATTSFIDYGTVAINPFKLAPEGNSTKGAIFNWMYVDAKNAQIFGITNDNKLYYSAPGTGDFSPYNGGGWVAIDENGDTQLNFVDGFRNGKGDPVVTVSARGAGGRGKLFHVDFQTLTVGDQAIVYPNVYEANGMSATYAPRATIKGRDSLWYYTGQDFKSTGTSQNILNILTTNSVATGIVPDMEKITVSALNKAVGIEYQDKLFFALPVSSTRNNEIWYLDMARKNAWVLRWPIYADDMWLYEDNNGATHFCVLVNNVIMEFTRAGSRTHVDDDTPWTSRVAFESLIWDEDGLTLGKIRNQYFKLLFPKGTINATATGLTRKGVQQAAGSDTFTVTTTKTGIGQWQYGSAFLAKDDAYKYRDSVGEIKSYGKSVAVLNIKPKGLLAQLDWEITSNAAGSDYILSAVNTKGFSLEDLVLKTRNN